jgi:hypothetical protein
MRGPPFKDTPPKITEEQRERFQKALKGQLSTRTCRDCPQSHGFVQVVEFLIDNWIEAVDRVDRASQTMEEFIALFKELEIREMKNRMLGEDGL